MPSSQILEYLHVGSLEDAQKWHLDYPGSNIICVMEKRPAKEPPTAIHFPLVEKDGMIHPRQLNRLVAVIHGLAQQGDKILVHCDTGTKLSPFAVAYYLQKQNGFSSSQAYDYIQAHRKEISEKSEWPKILE